MRASRRSRRVPLELAYHRAVLFKAIVDRVRIEDLSDLELQLVQEFEKLICAVDLHITAARSASLSETAALPRPDGSP